MTVERWSRKWGWVAVCALAGFLAGCTPALDGDARDVVVRRGGIRMTVPFQGELEARRVEQVAVGVQGAAVLTELLPEGRAVGKGDVLARFDSSQIEQDLARQENEWIRARQELDSLEKAELPLELLEMEARRAEAKAEMDAEARFLEAARDLQARGLMSSAEVEQQEQKMEALHTRAEQLDTRMALTRDHVHEARRTKARAALDAARQQRDFTMRQLELCEVRAPVSGVVTLVPLPVGGEYRPAHVGDTLYRNQVFLCLPDPSEYVVRGFAGEADLPFIRRGDAVEAVPVAFPDIRLSGRVESVGGMAQTRPGHPAWRKFFPVQIQLDPVAEQLPVGVSVHADVVTGEAADALWIPRAALVYRDGRAMVRRVDVGGRVREVAVETGLMAADRVEIVSGLSEGDRLRLP
ncbi:MAG: HlyD family efflux transporter periplasmic adaptor subunit [Verrucomicrobiota bacterium]|jgi:multidrug resistance efflux pump|nr:HlyD family efflux transporter periplasmic adaptor subunit [Verrucomicrobiota bacterium]